MTCLTNISNLRPFGVPPQLLLYPSLRERVVIATGVVKLLILLDMGHTIIYKPFQIISHNKTLLRHIPMKGRKGEGLTEAFLSYNMTIARGSVNGNSIVCNWSNGIILCGEWRRRKDGWKSPPPIRLPAAIYCWRIFLLRRQLPPLDQGWSWLLLYWF